MGNYARAIKEMEYVFTVRSGCHDTTVQVTGRYAFKEGIKNFFGLLYMNLITNFVRKKSRKMKLLKKLFKRYLLILVEEIF